MKRKNINKISVSMILFFSLLPPFQTNACDTWVALQDATKTGYVILAKNSDRPLFDSQPLMFFQRQHWPKNSEVDLGRIKIPQVNETFATLGSSPYWCWGYEEGINEFGVAIGNEGVFTKLLLENIQNHKNNNGPDLGPTGMDYIRLGLERGKTAKEALNVITNLLEKYGQFGSGLPTQGIDGAYDNSFIIADSKEAWILETTGKQWAAKKFTKGISSISNKISLRDDWDLSSKDLADFIVKKGWWENKSAKVDFTKVFIDDSSTGEMRNQRAQTRANCSFNLLKEKTGEIDPNWMKRIARDRSTKPSIDLDQTASSCVAILPDNQNKLPVFWWCPSVPSNSCYIPFFVHGSKLPRKVSRSGKIRKSVTPPNQVERDSFSGLSYWWLFKELSDLVSQDRNKRNPIVREEFDKLEKSFEEELPNIVTQAVELRKSGKVEEAANVLDEFTNTCFMKALEKVNELRKQFKNEVTETPEQYKPYVGNYDGFGPFKDKMFTVLVQNDKLAVDVPGQMIFQLKEPDEEGKWYFTLTNQAATSFEKDESGNVVAMKMHQATPAQKNKNQEDTLNSNHPPKYLPFVGKFTIPVVNKELVITVQHDNLAIILPEGDVAELKEPDEKGRRYFSDTNTVAVSFIKDDSGNITSINLLQTFRLPKSN